MGGGGGGGGSLETGLPGGCKQIQFPVRKKENGIHHSEFLLCFLQVNEKGMHDLEFLFVSFRNRKKECISLNSFYAFFKKERGFFKFCFSFCCGKEKGNMPCEFDFSFPGR